MKKLIVLAIVFALLCSCAPVERNSGASTASAMDEASGTDISEGAGDIIEFSPPESPSQADDIPPPLEQPDIGLDEAIELLTPDTAGIVNIASPQQLIALAALVNSGDESYKSNRYVLADNLDMSGIDFIPIGGMDKSYSGYSFDGAFDGGGHIISGLTIRDNFFEIGTGLFGTVGVGASIINTHVTNGNISGRYNTGGFVGENRGMISGCSFRGTVSSTCEAVGGFAGFANSMGESSGKISACAANAQVSGSSGVGGFAGLTAYGAVISDCYALGKTIAVASNDMDRIWQIGGFIGGNNNAAIERCYAVVEVYTNVTTDIVGGFIGYNYGSPSSCFYSEAAVSNWKGVCYDHENKGYDVKACTVEEITEQITFTGWDFKNTWGIAPDKNRGLPYLLAISG